MAITYEQVATAAESIKGAGEKPTLSAVHARLGSGSMSTITKYMQRWKNEQPQQQVSETTIPEPLKAMLMQEMERYASQRVSVVRDDLDEANQTIEAITAECETLTNEISGLDESNNELAIRLEQREKQVDELERKSDQLSRERYEFKELSEGLRLELATAKALNESLQDDRQRIVEKAHAEVEEAKTAARDANDKIISLSNAEARLTAKNETLNETIAELRKALQAATERAQAVDALEAKLAQRDDSISELKSSKTQLETALHDKSMLAASLEGKCEILSNEVSALKAKSQQHSEPK